MLDKISLKEQMLEDALIIIESAEWGMKRFDEKVKELEKAERRSDFPKAERIKLEIEDILRRLNKEDKNMENFMAKYHKILNDKKINKGKLK